mmetsp:Transcript_105716/g.268614  ORF Transcript_105716/g.268614 Transcript_105716/m.268614 type:complete len:328 (+) Transcript_105716:85-1068(+)
MEGGLEKDIGETWFEGDDLELDRFLEEDALLDAIQNAPGLDTEVAHFEMGALDDAGNQAYGGSSASNATAGYQALEANAAPPREAAGAPDGPSTRPSGAAPALAAVPNGAVEMTQQGGSLQRRPPQEPQQQLQWHSPSSDARAIGAGDAGGKVPPRAVRRKTPPWKSLALMVMSVFGIIYVGLGLFEDGPPRKHVPSDFLAEPKEIQLPAQKLGGEAGVGSTMVANGTAFGVTHVESDVRRSSDDAFNVSAWSAAQAAAVGNGTAPETEPPASAAATAAADATDEGASAEDGADAAGGDAGPRRPGDRKGRSRIRGRGGAAGAPHLR